MDITPEEAPFLASALQVIAGAFIARLKARQGSRSQKRAKQLVSDTVAEALRVTVDVSALGDNTEPVSILLDRQIAIMVDRLVMFHLIEAEPRAIDLAQEQLVAYIERTRSSQTGAHSPEQLVTSLNEVIAHGTGVIKSKDKDIRVRLPQGDVRTELYLDAIVRRLDAWRDTSERDWTRHNDVMLRLAAQTHRHLGVITPPDPDRNVRIPIGDLFVPPEMSLSSKQFLESQSDTVILGNPGAGKSTVIRHLAYQLSANRLADSTQPDVVLIRLKDYSDYITQVKRLSLLQFAAEAAKVKFQMESIHEHLQLSAESGTLVLCVDGLDEVVDVPSRRRIVQAVEAFSTLYPDCRVVVSSREAGYKRAEISGQAVLRVSIAPFDRARIAAYAAKWFAIAAQPEDLDRTVAGFLRDTGPIQDIASNPLMLSLLCILYRGQGSLPESRPAVYWQCSELMYRRWDADRGIELADQLGVFIRPVVEELAFSLLTPNLYPDLASQQRQVQWSSTSDQQHRSPMSESAILGRIARMLEDWKYDEEPERARELAYSFLRHCYERSWVLVPQDEPYDGEVEYEFAHRTFQEFLVAAYFVRTVGDYQDFKRILLAQLSSPEWEVIIELALQMRAAQAPSEIADFIDSAIELCDSGESTSASDSVEAVAVTSIELAALRNKLLGATAYLDLRQSALRRLADWVLPAFKVRNTGTWRFALLAKAENARRLADVIEGNLTEEFATLSIADRVERILCLEQLRDNHFEEAAVIDEVATLWVGVIDRMLQKHVEAITELTESDGLDIGDRMRLTAVSEDLHADHMLRALQQSLQ